MYESYYKLSNDPFQLRPREQAGYEHASYASAKAYVVYAMNKSEGILVVSGAAGTGKSTLIRDCIHESDKENVTFIEISSGSLSAAGLRYIVASKLGIEAEEFGQARIQVALQKKLELLHDKNERAILLIDEAQSLQDGAFDEVKALSNMEYKGSMLLQVFLVGQKTLIDTLKKPELEPVMQRITAACELNPMSEKECEEYIKHCLSKASWTGVPHFSDEAFESIYLNGKGIPRRTNLICSRLLLFGMLRELSELGLDDVHSVLDDLYEEGLLGHRVDILADSARLASGYPKKSGQ